MLIFESHLKNLVFHKNKVIKRNTKEMRIICICSEVNSPSNGTLTKINSREKFF